MLWSFKLNFESRLTKKKNKKSAHSTRELACPCELLHSNRPNLWKNVFFIHWKIARASTDNPDHVYIFYLIPHRTQEKYPQEVESWIDSPSWRVHSLPQPIHFDQFSTTIQFNNAGYRSAWLEIFFSTSSTAVALSNTRNRNEKSSKGESENKSTHNFWCGQCQL